MKLENLKLSEVIKLIEEKPSEIKKISSGAYSCEFVVTDFVVDVYFWTINKYTWTVELKPIKKELTREEIGQAWDIESVTVKNAKLSSESKFFKAICERLGL